MSGPWQDIIGDPDLLVRVPAKKPPKNIPALLRKIPKGAGWLGAAILLYELYEHVNPDEPTGKRWFGPGWTLCCRRSTNPVPAGYPMGAVKNIGGVACSGFNCNHPGAVLLLGQTQGSVTTRNFYDTRTEAIPDGMGFVVEEWVRPSNALVWPKGGRLFRGHDTPASLDEALADPGGALNPNVARILGSAAQLANPILTPGDAPWADPWMDPANRPLEDDLGVTITSPAIRVTVTPATAPAPAEAPAPGASPSPPAPSPGASPAPGTGGGGSVVVSTPSHPRQPPTKKTKERKVKSRGLRAFDIISEAGDAIDCFYKALPKNVRKKWDKKQSRASKMGENFGQYGFGGADYKTPALYHNWDKVDLAAALQCLVTNEIEDRIIGKIAAKSRGTAFGVSQTFRGLKAKDQIERAASAGSDSNPRG